MNSKEAQYRARYGPQRHGQPDPVVPYRKLVAAIDTVEAAQSLLPHNRKLLDQHVFGWRSNYTDQKDEPCVLLRVGKFVTGAPIAPVTLITLDTFERLLKIGFAFNLSLEQGDGVVAKISRFATGKATGTVVNLNRLVYCLHNGQSLGLDVIPLIHPRCLHYKSLATRKPGKKRKAISIPKKDEIELVRAEHQYKLQTLHSSYYAFQMDLERLLVPVERANLRHFIVPLYPTK